MKSRVVQIGLRVAVLVIVMISSSSVYASSNIERLFTASTYNLNFIKKIWRVPVSKVRDLSKLSKTRKSKVCLKLESSWTNYEKAIKELPERSPFVSRSLIRMVAARLNTCEVTPEYIYDVLLKVKQLGGRSFTDLVTPKTLNSVLPVSAVGLHTKDSVDLNVFYAFSKQNIFNSARTTGCGTQFPETANCISEFIFDRLVKPETTDVKKIVKDIERRVLKKKFVPSSWPRFYSYIFKVNGTGSIKIVRKLLRSKKSSSVKYLLSENSNELLSIFNVTKGMKRVTSCLKAKKLFSETFLALKATSDEDILPIAYKVISSVCKNDDQYILAREISTHLSRDFEYSAKVSNLAQPKLYDISIEASDDDKLLRSKLDLKFQLGSNFDIQDMYKGQDPRLTMTDSVIAAFLRQVDSTPWVNIVENIEDVDVREKLFKVMNLKLGQKKFEGRRFLQLIYLGYYDNLNEVGTASTNLINEIRLESASIASKLHSFVNINFSIHNSLQPGVVNQVGDFIDQMSSSEIEEYGALLNTLLSKLKTFFNVSLNPEELVRIPMDRLSKVSPEIYTNYKVRLEKIAELSQENRLEAILKFGSQILKEIKKDERFLRRKFIDTKFLEQNSEFATLYVNKLRMISAVNVMVQGNFGSIDSSHFSRLKKRYTSYLNSLIGSTKRATSNIYKLSKRISDIVYGLFNSRLARFHWFISSQSHRKIDNPDYKGTLFLRLHTMKFFVEKMIRDMGLQYISNFDVVDQKITRRIMNTGVAVGVLRYVSTEKLGSFVYKANEIIITQSLPLNLGVTSGLITEVFQPLSSHVDLRTKERGTPNAFVKDAGTKYKKYIGQLVKLEVTSSRVKITKVKKGTVATVVHKPAKVEVPVADISDKDFLNLDDDEDDTTIAKVGAKAFGFAHLRRIFGEDSYIPKGYVVPFGAYEWFIKEFKLDEKIKSLLADKSKLSSEDVSKRLNELRVAFSESSMSESFKKSDFYDELIDDLKDLKKETKKFEHGASWAGCLRFRSSTNSEDLVGFTGAGLYSSKTGCLDDDKKSPAVALGKVWGSLWTDRAFSEREYYGIDHQMVKMAVLVHRNFPEEIANGVLLTKSQIDELNFVSVQPGETSVTNSKGGKLGDEIRASLIGDDLRIVSASYFDKGKSVLTEAELNELLQAGKKIWTYFRRVFGKLPTLPTMRMDIEFKFINDANGNRKLFIKQARPFMQGI